MLLLLYLLHRTCAYHTHIRQPLVDNVVIITAAAIAAIPPSARGVFNFVVVVSTR